MIELVRNAETKGKLQRDYGGRTGALFKVRNSWCCCSTMKTQA